MRSLRSHLVGLVLLAMLPFVVISTMTAIQAIGAFREIYEAGLQGTVQALALSLDREIDTLSTALTVVGTFPELDEGGDLSAFQARAKEVASALGTVIALRRPDGSLAFSTQTARGPAGQVPETADLSGDAVRRDGGAPLDWPRGGPLVVAVDHQVVRHGRVVGILAIGLNPSQMAPLLDAETRTRGADAVIADGRGGVIARTRATPAAPPSAMPDWIATGARGRSVGLLQGQGPEGQPTVVAFARPAHAPDWIVYIMEPKSLFNGAWRVPLAARLGVAVAGLALAVSAAAWLGRGLSRPLIKLTEHAQASAFGAEPPATSIPRSSVSEFEALRASFERAETILRRRRAAERMALQEARTGHELLASVVNGTADLIYVKDLDLCFVLANRAALAMGGEAREEWNVLGRRSTDLIPLDAAAAEEALDREVMATGELRSVNVEWASPVGADTPIASPHGRRTFALTKTPWRDAEGAICGVVTVARDVTRQRAAETRLTQVQGELLRASRLSAMGAMASGLAHELNQPLAAATNFLNAAVRLLDRATGRFQTPSIDAPVLATPVLATPVLETPVLETPVLETPVLEMAVLETARTAVSQAAQQTLRAGGIVRRLRDFIGRGEAELRIEDIADVIREACDVARADAGLRSPQLVVAVSPESGLVLADRTQMQQVLLNLIRNAGEALADQADGRIEVTAGRAPSGAIEITVADNGPGLSETVAARLFQPFVSTKTNGMGIGLAICGTIVEGHGGRLVAAASREGGALFRITLPSVEPPAEPPEPREGPRRMIAHDR